MRKVDPVKHEEKRQEILAAAGRCFIRDGFRGASTADICAAANISPGHLYHYFESKEAIIGAMVESRLKETAARFSALSEGSGSIAALLFDVESAPARRERTAQQPLLLEVLAEAGRNATMAKILQEHTQGMRTMLADVLRKGQDRGQIDPGLDPELTASVLISVLDGSKTLGIRDPKIDANKSAQMLKTLIDRFLAPRPSKDAAQHRSAGGPRRRQRAPVEDAGK